MKKFEFRKIDPQKEVVSFTWDDNLTSHSDIIAPIFIQFNKRCSFYINPGESNFFTLFLGSYRHLKAQGFEIGSHSYTHCHLSSLSGMEYINQIKSASDSIESNFGVRPSTFAFPHHDFDEKMLSQARSLYIETRNTLYNSVRFSLKTATSLERIEEALKEARKNSHTLVFSGHGAFNEGSNLDICGYEPVSNQKLQKILEITDRYPELQVCTFEQAVLKTYLLLNCKNDGQNVWIDDMQISYLQQYGLTVERISELI